MRKNLLLIVIVVGLACLIGDIVFAQCTLGARKTPQYTFFICRDGDLTSTDTVSVKMAASDGSMMSSRTGEFKEGEDTIEAVYALQPGTTYTITATGVNSGVVTKTFMTPVDTSETSVILTLVPTG